MDDLIYAVSQHLHATDVRTSSGIPYVEEPDPSIGPLFNAIQM